MLLSQTLQWLPSHSAQNWKFSPGPTGPHGLATATSTLLLTHCTPATLVSFLFPEHAQLLLPHSLCTCHSHCQEHSSQGIYMAHSSPSSFRPLLPPSPGGLLTESTTKRFILPQNLLAPFLIFYHYLINYVFYLFNFVFFLSHTLGCNWDARG